MKYTEIRIAKQYIRDIQEKKIVDINRVIDLINYIKSKGYIRFTATNIHKTSASMDKYEAMFGYLGIVENHLKRHIDEETTKHILHELKSMAEYPTNKSYR